MPPRDQTPLRTRDRSLVNILLHVERALQECASNILVAGNEIRSQADRLEAMERQCSDCAKERARCRQERSERNLARGRFWMAIGAFFSYKPVQILLTAIVLAAVAAAARYCPEVRTIDISEVSDVSEP